MRHISNTLTPVRLPPLSQLGLYDSIKACQYEDCRVQMWGCTQMRADMDPRGCARPHPSSTPKQHIRATEPSEDRGTRSPLRPSLSAGTMPVGTNTAYSTRVSTA